MLERLLKEDGDIALCCSAIDEGAMIFDKSCELGLEGIVSKLYLIDVAPPRPVLSSRPTTPNSCSKRMTCSTWEDARVIAPGEMLGLRREGLAGRTYEPITHNAHR